MYCYREIFTSQVPVGDFVARVVFSLFGRRCCLIVQCYGNVLLIAGKRGEDPMLFGVVHSEFLLQEHFSGSKKYNSHISGQHSIERQPPKALGHTDRQTGQLDDIEGIRRTEQKRTSYFANVVAFAPVLLSISGR